MITFADILARSSGNSDDSGMKILFIIGAAVIAIVSSILKNKAKLPPVPRPWQPPPTRPRTAPMQSPPQPARRFGGPMAKPQVRQFGRSPAVPPPLPPAMPVQSQPRDEILVAARVSTTKAPAAEARVRKLIGRDLRRALLLAEVLAPPVSMREERIV